MKSAIETINPTRVKLTVEVPFDELKPQMDAAYKKIASQVNIPGFRKGKVPAKVIEQRFGRGAVLQEAVDEALPKFYSDAVVEHTLRPLGSPEIEITELPETDDKQFAFTAEVNVRPEINLPDFSSLTIEVDDIEVTDADIDERLDSLRERFGTLVPVDRAAAEGDFVTLDLVASVDGEQIDEAKDLSHRVGSGQLIEGTDQAVTGLKAGESATFTASLTGGEHAGKDADISVTLTAVKERSLPELNDDFAQLASEFDTLAELREDAAKQVESAKRFNQGLQAREKLMEYLEENVTFDVPENIIEAEVERHFESGHEHAEDEDQTEHRAEVEANTRKALRSQLMLDVLAEDRSVEVEQNEIIEYLVMAAQQYGMQPNEFAQALEQAGQVPAMIGEVGRRKALAIALEEITVKDASGNVVDLDAAVPDAGETVPAAQAPAAAASTDAAAVPAAMDL